MVRTVMADRRSASAIFPRSGVMIVIFATSIAMSLPCPMAMLKSACASAALSLMPSPTIATLCPAACNRRICPAFPSGSTEAA